MKEKEGFIDYPEQQMILYVEKEDGKFGPMQTGSYISANFMDDYLYKRKNLEFEFREQLSKGKISPVRYFMVLEDLTISELSARAKISKSKVKKHLDPDHFSCVTAKELIRYATVFNIPVANLFQVLLIHTGEQFESQLMLENKITNISVIQTATENPLVVLTQIGERK